jgi:hypothetical protein
LVKKCPKCKETKQLSDFYAQKNGKIYSYCKVCELNKQKQMRRNRPIEYKQKDKNKRIKKEYGIDLKEYDELEKAQEYKCAICKNLRGLSRFGLHIDHCHKTGKIRGLLCQSCNMGLGNFKDNPSLLLKAVEYLNENKV